MSEPFATSEEKADHLLDFGGGLEVLPDIFIETGTARGDLTAAMWASGYFEDVATIESEADMYQTAVLRFLAARVSVIHGDSGEWLPMLLDTFASPAFIWLDAHEVGPDDDANTTAFPAEFAAVLHREPVHLVAVDDARLFGHGHYPDLDWVETAARDGGYRFIPPEHDIFWLVPA